MKGFCFGHADPAVTDAEQHVPAGAHTDVAAGIGGVQVDVRCLEREPAPFRHGVAGVGGQIHDDLLDLAPVGFYAFERRVERDYQGDVLANQPPQHLAHVGDYGVEVQHRRLEHLSSAERQELAGQVGGSVGRVLDERDVRTQWIVGLQYTAIGALCISCSQIALSDYTDDQRNAADAAAGGLYRGTQLQPEWPRAPAVPALIQFADCR